MQVLDSYCVICASVTAFEQPPCRDAHDRDCPEWICRRCGAAVLIGTWPETRRRPRRRQAA